MNSGLIKAAILLPLMFGAIKFTDNLNYTYTPAAHNTVYTGAFNNWSIFESMVTYGETYTTPRMNGSLFYGYSNYYPQMGKIFRSLEGYTYSRPVRASCSLYVNGPGGAYGRNVAMLNFFGSTTYNTHRTNSDATIPQIGGVSVGLRCYNGTTIAFLAVNNSIVQSYTVTGNTTYTFFLDVTGTTISWSYNTTGIKPSTPMYSYTGSITGIDKVAMLYMDKAPSNWGGLIAQLDDFSVILL